MNRSSILSDSPLRLDRLRNVLKNAGFAPDEVLRTIGVKDSVSIKESDLLLLMHRTRAMNPLDTLIRLFLLEIPVQTSALARAIEPMTPDEWEEMGLITVRDGSAEANIKLFPYQDMVIAYDLPRRLQTPEGQDYVMGVGGSSITLANLTIRRDFRSALDLGSGCGFQALLAAIHCEQVIAVDLNPRATAFARFNAKFNGLASMECREGDLFGPVEGMKFDLIVSNPPFVISPESRYTYRDSSMAGDEVCRKIAGEAPRFLNEGGFFQMLCNWTEITELDWRERIREWFDGSGCDVWVMRNQSRDAATYAANWIRHTEKLETENLCERFDEWMEYYGQQQIERIGGGVVVMRRRSCRQNWFRTEDGVETMYGPGGEAIMRGFDQQDFLENVADDAALLRMSFTASPEARLVKQKRLSKDGWLEEASELRLASGIFRSGSVDPYVERLFIRCDGSSPLENLIEEMAADLEVDRASLEPPVCEMVRRFIGQGFLLPPAEAAP